MPSFAKEQLRKVFIGGLNLQTNEEGMKEYFSRWGECVDVVVMRYPDTRRSRGFGFVTYDRVESVDAVLNAKPHILDGKDIEPKRAVARDETGRPGGTETEKSTKVFIGGLPSSTTEDDVRECFEKFCEEAGNGKVEEVILLKDKENNDRLRGFGFVTFDTDEIVDKVCSVKYFEIKTKTVEVRRAETRQAMRKKSDKDSGYKRRPEDSYPRSESSGNSRGGYNNMGGSGFASGMNPAAMQAAMSAGGGMPFFGGAFGAGRGGPGGFGGNFGMNPYGFGGMMGGFGPGMLSMLANSMGMNAMGGGGMGGGGMGGGGGGGGAGGGEQGFRKDSMRASSNTGYNKPAGYSGDSHNTTATTSADVYSGQNSTGYDQTADMSAFSNQMNSMWGAGAVTPASVQAAMLAHAGYSGTGMENTGEYNQLGAYNNQTSSYYGPARGTPPGKATSTDSTRRGFKPY